MGSRASRLPARRIAWNPIASWLPGKRHQRTLGTGPPARQARGADFPYLRHHRKNRHTQASHPDRLRAPHHGQQSREVIALSATGQLGMAAHGQIQLTVVSAVPR